MQKLLYILLLLPFSLVSQKEIYIPIEWQQGSLDYSLARSAESDNFIVFWGPLTGVDPTQAPPEIAFNPQAILNTAEELYKFYIDTIQFVNDDSGLISEYKIILVMLHTWTGLEGWAFGGNYDGIVGAMWMHPHAASSGPTLAHEFTHTLQNYTWMMNPGHGFIDSSYVGFFWETHAEFMALQRYPSVALEFDMARWLNTNQFHWSSTRHHYQAFVFLQFIKEKDGIGMINRLWNESNIGEHPLETYKRLKGISQRELNNLFGEYAMRNVTWDYEIGALLRERVSTINPVFMAHQTIIPEIIDTSRNWYRIQNHLAPQDYGYNIIRLYPEPLEGCDKRSVYLNFKSQYILPHYEEAGLRYGFVAVDNLHQPRYSEMYDRDDEVIFELADDETELYLVVVGAPNFHHNYAWEIGFPKIYRYPYEFRLKGAMPEGFQDGFNEPPSGVVGAPHINGGGFVASTAQVESSVFVGPNARVLDFAQVSGDARIEDYATIQHSAMIDEDAVVSGMAIVGEDAHVYGQALITEQAHVFGASEVYDSAVIDGNALIFYTRVYDHATLSDNTFSWGSELHGDVHLGGDAEFFRECDNGTYLQFESAYNRNCDGLDDHPANIDVTQYFSTPDHDGYYSLTCDGLVENIINEFYWVMCKGDTFYFNGDPITDSGFYEKIFQTPEGVDSIVTLLLDLFPTPTIVIDGKICEGDSIQVDSIFYSAEGLYSATVIDMFGCTQTAQFQIEWYDVDTSVVRQGDVLVALATASSFQWFDCSTNLPIPGAHQSAYTPVSSGSYKVEVTDIHGCKAFSHCYDAVIVSTSGPNSFSFNLFPNPVTDFLEIYLQDVDHDLRIEVFDILGQIQLQKTLGREIDHEKIDVKNLPPGTYILKLINPLGHSFTKNFSKI